MTTIRAWVLALLVAAAAPPAVAAEVEVDLELVLAVDISYSMDPDEQDLQRRGYVEAIQSPEVLAAVSKGLHRRIAVTYVEWAGAAEQRVIVPWRLIDGPSSAHAFAADLAEQPIRRAYRTSISGAVDYAARLFEANGYVGERLVVDVSGDGANNMGRTVTTARDEAAGAGIVVNGLPILLKRPNQGLMDLPDLDTYYHDCVIAGPGAFIVPVRTRDGFQEAIRRKLILEISGLTPEPEARVQKAAGVDCLIGEKLWQERWERGDFFR